MSDTTLAMGTAASVLRGCKVVDFTSNIAGPYCTLVLADLGAEVFKVERPEGDPSRTWSPAMDGVATAYQAMNRGKLSVVLDLRDPNSREAVTALVKDADVVVTSHRPATRRRLGLDADSLQRINPNLICVDIDAFGDVGPLAGDAGYDAVVQAFSGMMDLTGYPDGPPARIGTGIVDISTGLWAALAVVAGLLARTVNGTGTRAEVPMLGAATSFLMHHMVSAESAGVVPSRLGTAQHNAAPYEVVRVADGAVMIAAANQGLWERLCRAFNCPDLAADERFLSNERRVANRFELVGELEDRLAGIGVHQAVDVLREAGVPASAVSTIAELLTDPQVAALGLWSVVGDRRFPAIPLRFDGEPQPAAGPVDGLGKSTEAVLRSVGLAEETISRLVPASSVSSKRQSSNG